MLRGVTVGDAHFDKLRKHFPDQDIDLQLNEIDKVYRHAQREGIRNVFWLGDIGEGYKDFTGVLRMSEEAQTKLFRFLKERDKEFNQHVYIGNHDFSGLDSHTMKLFFELQKQKVFKTTRFFDKETVLDLEGVRTTILPYPLLKPTSSKPSLCFAHYETKGSIRDNGRQISEGEEHDYDGHTFIQGHLHTRQVVRKRHHYPGTLYQTSFGESLPKGFMEFSAKPKAGGFKFTHRFVDTDPSFKLLNHKVYKKSDLRKIEDNPLYRYKLFVSEDIRLTEDDLAPYPNIVNRLSFSDEKELEALELSEFVMENQEIDLRYDKALDAFLKHKGLDKQQIKRGHEILEQRNRRKGDK